VFAGGGEKGEEEGLSEGESSKSQGGFIIGQGTKEREGGASTFLILAGKRKGAKTTLPRPTTKKHVFPPQTVRENKN